MTDSMIITHSWERFGFKAPFRVVGLWSAPSPSLAEHNPESYNLAQASAPRCCHGTCDVCGMGIIHHFIVTDATGRAFSVGSDCVAKTDDTKLVRQVDAIKRDARREVAQAKAKAKRQAAWEAAEAKRNADLDQQRANNNGLTDAEKAANEAALVRANREEVNADLVAALECSDFGRSVLQGFLDYGYLPRNRAFDICADIFAKYHGGRSGSKAYNTHHDRFFDLYGDKD